MGSVEVDAKIRGDDGATLQEPSKYHTRDELQKEVIDLDRLNPDVNGDGKVSASEARIYSLLRKQDVSGDGKLTIGELYKGLEALTKVDKKRSLFTKGFGIMSLVSVLQVLLIVGLVAVVLVATKDSFVSGGALTASSGDILKVSEATQDLPLYVLPVLPGKQRGTLSTISISYRDSSMHAWMEETGMIRPNETNVVYPKVNETLAVLWFGQYNATAADIGVPPKRPNEVRKIRVLNGKTMLITERADGTARADALCAGKVTCASFTVEASLADQLKADAAAGLAAAGVDVPAGRALAEEGECPCKSGYVKDADGAWVLAEGSRRLFSCEDAIDAEAAALAADLGMTHGSCAELREAGECDRDVVKQKCAVSCDACGTAAPPHERFGCEDAPDELVAKITEEVLGGAVTSCADLKDIVGACEHEQVQMHCPESCGLCGELYAQDRMAMRRQRQLDKCRG